MAQQQPSKDIQLQRRTRKNSRKKSRPGILSHLLLLGMLACAAWFFYNLFQLDFLPENYFYIALAVFALLFLLFRFLWLHKTRRKITRFLCSLIAIACGAASLTGAYYVQLTNDMIETVTDIASARPSTVTVVAHNDSGIETLSDLNGKKIAVISQADPEGMEHFIADIQSKANVELVEFSDVYTEARGLYDGVVDAIALPESFRQALHDTADFYEFQFWTHDVYRTQYTPANSQNLINPADPVANVTKNPFTIYISGNDSYGAMEPTARSDVNMLVTINPRTYDVLITSIPRDSYVYVTCKKNETACEYGSVDKLTHSGLDGVGVSESTIEDLLDIDINYTMRVNFSSLTSLVNALGGIDVYVEEGYAVEQFHTNPHQGVVEGWNHLDGEGALAFSRERYAYEEGDLQRIKNQQTVIEAIIKKVLSPSMILNYPELMDALSVAFETNLTAQDIRSLVQLQLGRWPSWNLESYSIDGWVGSAWCTKLQDYASVTNLYDDSVDAATAKIQAVLSGQKADSVKAPVYPTQADGSLNTGPVDPIEEGDVASQKKDPASYWG